MHTYLTPLLLGIALVNACLFFVSIVKVRNSTDKYTFIFGWGFVIGAFIWEDVILFSAFFFLASILTLLLKDLRIGLLLLLSFWIVRSAGEALYMFLQQFHEPKHAPHYLDDLFKPLRVLFGNISTQKCYIIMQIMWQVILTLALTGIVLLLLHWQSIPAWA